MKEKKQKVDEQEVKTATEAQEQTQTVEANDTVQSEPDYKEKYLRLLSEFTQFQRQKEDEIRSMAVYGNKSLLLKMVDLLDDMDMGLIQEGLSEETKGVLTMLRDKFANTLRVESVTEISVQPGDAYDPQTCEVISTMDDPDNKGKVIHIARKGYYLGERVLRTAKVVVGK